MQTASTLPISPNASISATIDELLELGLPPIPVAPKHRSNEGFSGKNPSYLDSDGRHRFVRHGQFKDRLPTTDELSQFFQHQDVGIGVLGGVGGVYWLDLDRKNYPSQQDCDRAFDAIVERICSIAGCTRADLWIEQTGSGGYRLPIIPAEQPDFTNFTTTEGGDRVGECLGRGRFAVLAPTIHPSGNAYRRIEFGKPIAVPNLASIGIYPAKDEIEQKERQQRRRANYVPPVASLPGDNPWDIRNFAQYFEGYTERGNGWGYAQCPHHADATSKTSFRVNLNTGQFKAWCGCNTKAVYRSGLDLAVSLGYQLPEKSEEPQRDRTSPQPSEVGRERWDEKQLYKRIAQLSGQTSKRPKSKPENLGRVSLKQPDAGYPNTDCSAIVLCGQLPPDKLPYVQGALPTFEEWQAMGNPEIRFQEGDRVTLKLEMIENGYPAALDRSTTGQGKSTEAAKLAKQYLNIYSEQNDKGRQPKVLYLSNDHRNPSTDLVELLSEDLIARDDGLVKDPTRKTALENDFLVRRKGDQKPDIEPTCINTEAFNESAAKGHQQFAGKDSPICNGDNPCPLFVNGTCHYLNERKRQIEQVRFLRSAIDSAPISSNDLAIVEEAQHEVSGTKETTIGADALAKEALYLSIHSPDLYRQSFSAIAAIQKTVDASLDDSKHNRHGFAHASIMDRLPSKDELLQAIWDETPNADPWDLPTLADISKQILQATAPIWEELFAGVTDPERRAQIVRDRVCTGYLAKIFRIIDGRDRTTDLRIVGGKLILSERNHHQQNNLAKARFIDFLDATANKVDLAKSAGMNPSAIAEIKQAPPTFPNLTIKLVQGLGRIGSQRRGKRGKKQDAPASPYEIQQRLIAAVTAIKGQSEGEGAIFDNKAYLPEYESLGLANGAHFRDNRGRNYFSNCSYLISVGTATPNLGQMLSEWHCEGNKPTALQDAPGAFWARVQRRQLAETVQTIGRLRAHIPPIQDKTAWIIPGRDLSENAIAELQAYFPGCTVELMDAYELTPAAAPKGEQTRRGLVEAIWNDIAAGKNPKLDAIAKANDIKKAHASNTIKALTGQGFKHLKKSLFLLFNALNSKSKLSQLPSDLQWLALTFLPDIATQLSNGCIAPDEALGEFVNVAQSVGVRRFAQILASTPAWALTTFLQHFLLLLGEKRLDELRRETMGEIGGLSA